MEPEMIDNANPSNKPARPPKAVVVEGDRILRFPEVVAKVGRPRSSIYLMIKAGHFPDSVKIGAKAVGWHSSTVDAWLASKVSKAS